VVQLLAVGRVARAHGVRGRILLVPYNEDSQELVRVGELWLRAAEGEPRKYEVARAERANLGYLVALRGVDDRDAADALRGLEALVDRAALPAADEDELYAVDLIGMSVVDAAGVERGTVVEVESAGLQDLLRVDSAGKVALVPFGLVREVDEAARRISIDAPEGLFDLEE
jgi:16S rRNA processing protein RimM